MAEKIKVKLDANGGSGGPNETIVLGEDSPIGAQVFEDEPSRPGYKFVGWATEKDAFDVDFVPGTRVEEPMTVYAVWSAGKIHTVSFDANGGENPPAPIKVLYGASVGLPSTKDQPKRAGYKFMGWSKSKLKPLKPSDIDDYYFEIETETDYVSSDEKYYAVWCKYNTIHFDSMDGETVKDLNTIESLIDPPMFRKPKQRQGKRFAGWSFTHSGEPIDEVIHLEGEITLHAIWVDTVDVRFKAEGSDDQDIYCTADKGQSLKEVLYSDDLPEVDSNEDKVFVGWATSKNADKPNVDINTKLESDMIFYPVWKEKVSVIFNFEDEEYIGSGYKGQSLGEIWDKTANEYYIYGEDDYIYGEDDYIDDEGEYIIDDEYDYIDDEGKVVVGWADSESATQANMSADFVVDSDIVVYCIKGTAYTIKIDTSAIEELDVYWDGPSEIAIRPGRTFDLERLPSIGIDEEEGQEYIIGWAKSTDPTKILDVKKPLEVNGNITLKAVAKEGVRVAFVEDPHYFSDYYDIEEESILVARGEAVDTDNFLKIERAKNKFKGWSTKKYSNEVDVFGMKSFDSDTVLYPVWENNIKLHFDYNDGSGKSEDFYWPVDQHTYAIFEDHMGSLEREGYTFIGWSTSLDSMDLVNLYEDIESDLNCYAIWGENKTLTLNPNGGSPGTRYVSTYTDAYVEDVLEDVEEPTRLGYKFAGWALTPDATKKDDIFLIPDYDLTLYAVWKPECKVILDLNDGSGRKITQSVPKGGSIYEEDVEDFELNGFVHIGWSENPSATEADFDLEEDIYSDTTLYAVWKRACKISYDTKGGKAMPPDIVAEGAEWFLDEARKGGYAFEGWATSPEKTESDVSEPLLVNNDITLYAIWGQPVYVKFDMNANGEASKTIGTSKGRTIDINDLELAEPQKEKAGKIFVGWSTSETAKEPDFNSEIKVSDNMVVYAVWKDACLVKYNDGMGGKVTTKKVAKGKKLGDLIYKDTDSYEEGYTFVGWSKDKSSSEPIRYNDETPINSDITLYGIWKKEFTIKFDANGGTLETKEAEVPEGPLPYSCFGSPYKPGYMFAGWATNKEAKEADFIEGYPVKGDMTVYAVWTSRCRITFDKNGGKAAPEPIIVAKGSSAGYDWPSISGMKRAGYAFGGWSTNKNATKADFNNQTVVNSDITVYAVWKTPCTIQFDDNGGFGGPNRIKSFVDEELDLDPFFAPEREGYVFLGWSENASAQQADYTDKYTAKGDKTLYAVWAKLHTVSFDANGGSQAPTYIIVMDGNKLGEKYPTNIPTRPNHRFAGWAIGDSTEANFSEETVINSDLTVKALWVETVTVTFKSNGGSQAPASITVDKGQALGDIFPADKLKRKSALFKGWSTRKNGVWPNFKKDTIVNEDITVYAVWHRIYNKAVYTMKPGSKKTLKLPKSVVRSKVKWKSFNTKRAKFDKKGKLIAVGPGIVNVQGRYKNKIYKYKIRIAPKKPAKLKAKKSGSRVKLTWKKPKGARGLVIYRAKRIKGKYKFKKIKTLKIKKNKSKGTLKVKQGKGKYAYYVKAYGSLRKYTVKKNKFVKGKFGRCYSKKSSKTYVKR